MDKIKLINQFISDLGFDPDEYCENDLSRLVDYFKTILLKLKDTNQSFGKIRIVSLDSIKSSVIKEEIIQFLGKEISFSHLPKVGVLVGIAEDYFDYYYVLVGEDGKLFYNSCIDNIRIAR